MRQTAEDQQDGCCCHFLTHQGGMSPDCWVHMHNMLSLGRAHTRIHTHGESDMHLLGFYDLFSERQSSIELHSNKLQLLNVVLH